MNYMLMNGSTIEAIYCTDDEGKKAPHWKPFINGQPNDQVLTKCKTIMRVDDKVIELFDECIKHNYSEHKREWLAKLNGYEKGIHTPKINAKKEPFMMGTSINVMSQKIIDESLTEEFGKFYVVDALESGDEKGRGTLVLATDDEENKYIIQIRADSIFSPSRVMYKKSSSVLDELFFYALDNMPVKSKN